MNNMLMTGMGPGPAAGPAMGPQQDMSAQGPLIDPQQLAAHRNELAVVHSGLLKLAAQPKGSLSKRSLFDAVAEMIAGGAFSTPQAKQGIIAQLAELPDDEAAIRQAVGQRLLGVNDLQSRFHAQHGAE